MNAYRPFPVSLSNDGDENDCRGLDGGRDLNNPVHAVCWRLGVALGVLVQLATVGAYVLFQFVVTTHSVGKQLQMPSLMFASIVTLVLAMMVCVWVHELAIVFAVSDNNKAERAETCTLAGLIVGVCSAWVVTDLLTGSSRMSLLTAAGPLFFLLLGQRFGFVRWGCLPRRMCCHRRRSSGSLLPSTMPLYGIRAAAIFHSDDNEEESDHTWESRTGTPLPTPLHTAMATSVSPSSLRPGV